MPLSVEKTVSSAQSLCEPWKRTCSPVFASMARTLLSPHPKAIFVPSGDQLTSPSPDSPLMGIGICMRAVPSG